MLSDDWVGSNLLQQQQGTNTGTWQPGPGGSELRQGCLPDERRSDVVLQKGERGPAEKTAGVCVWGAGHERLSVASAQSRRREVVRVEL